MTRPIHILLLATSLVCLVHAQRPSYLGVGTGPIGRPGLANRFKTPETEAEEAAYQASHQQALEQASMNTGVNNRFGADGTVNQAAIPVDARGDADLVDRLNQWPRENRPFWLLNAAAIEANRNNAVDASTVVQGMAPGRSTGGQSINGEPLVTRLGTAGVDSTEFDSVERDGALVKSRPITPPPPRSSFLGDRPARK